MDLDLDLIAKGLAQRLGEIVAAIDRFQAFAFRPEAPGRSAAPEADDAVAADAVAAARDFVLRMLRAAADPLDAAILDQLAAGDRTVGALAEHLGLPHVAAWERVNDLVQVGLVARELDGDRVGLTPAGGGVAGFIEQLAARIAEASSP